MKHHPVLVGLVDAVGAAVYVALVATVMSSAQQWFGPADRTPFDAIAALLLFVLSAAVMGSVVFIRPALAYFNGQKKEALVALAWTIGFLFLFTLVAFLIVVAVR